MAPMPDLAAEAAHAVTVARADIGHLFHHGQPRPSFTPKARTSSPSQPEVQPMNIRDEIIHLLTVADDDAVHVVNVALSHPEGMTVLSDVAALAGLNVPPGTITSAATGLKAVLGLFGQQLAGQQPAQAAAPAGNGTQTAQAAKPMVV